MKKKTPQWRDGSWKGRACGECKCGGEKSARLSAGGVEFDSERGGGRGEGSWVRIRGDSVVVVVGGVSVIGGVPARKRDFNVLKDFPITAADTLHAQLAISRTLTAAQIG